MDWFLSKSRIVRLVSFTVFYVAQGLPIGLISIAFPAWLAEQGASPAQIASLLAVAGLPWAMKLFAGLFMDRFTFLAMGRRRPWALAAQLGLLVSMLLLVFVADPVNSLPFLTFVAFVVSAFTALQDVAIDGMAIDLLPVRERGKANSFMAFGQVAGYSLSGAGSAWLLQDFGLAVTALVLSIGVALILCWGILVRERPGEKRLPWTEGGESTQTQKGQSGDIPSIIRKLTRVLLMPTSLMLILAALLWRVADGFWLVGAPVLVVQGFGYASTEFSYWTSIFSLEAALAGLLLGPVIDRFGARMVMTVSLAWMGILYLLIGSLASMFQAEWLVMTMLLSQAVLYQACFISFIALAMGVCSNRVAATQFAIYMAFSNLARSMGAAIYGGLQPVPVQGQEFFVMGLCVFAAAALLMFVKVERHTQRIAELDAAAVIR